MHPMSDQCCCGQSRSESIANMLFWLRPQLNRKLRRSGQGTKPLNVAFALSAAAKLFGDTMEANLFTNIGLSRDGVEAELMIGRACTLTVGGAINSLDSNFPLCSGECGSDPAANPPGELQDHNQVERMDESEAVDTTTRTNTESVLHSSNEDKTGTVAPAAVAISQEGASSESSDKVENPQAALTLEQLVSVTLANQAHLKELLEGKKRRKATKRHSEGAPTAPRILQRAASASMPKSISLQTIPDGVLSEWSQIHSDATASSGREILAISECIRFHRSQKSIKRLEVTPTEFYDSSEDVLLTRGNHLARTVELAKEKASRSSSVTSAPPAKVVKKGESKSNPSKGKTIRVKDSLAPNDLRNRIPKTSAGKTGTSGTHVSRTFTNAALVRDRDTRSKEAKKAATYESKGQPTSSSSSSNLGVNKKTERKSKNVPLSTPILLEKMRKGEEFKCCECGHWVNPKAKYVCLNCKLDNHKFLIKRCASDTSVAFKEPNPKYETGEYPSRK